MVKVLTRSGSDKPGDFTISNRSSRRSSGSRDSVKELTRSGDTVVKEYDSGKLTETKSDGREKSIGYKPTVVRSGAVVSTRDKSGTVKSYLQTPSGRKRVYSAVDVIALSESNAERRRAYMSVINQLNPSQTRFYSQLPSTEKEKYLVQVANRSIQPVQAKLDFNLNREQMRFANSLSISDRSNYLKQLGQRAFSGKIAGQLKLSASASSYLRTLTPAKRRELYFGSKKGLVDEFGLPYVKATDLIISKVIKIPWKSDKGTARLQQELQFLSIGWALNKGASGTFENQVKSLLGNTLLGLGRGVVNMLTIALNPVETGRNMANFIFSASKNPRGVASQIVQAFINDPYGYIGETVSESLVVGTLGKYAKQSDVVRYINEERFIRSLSPQLQKPVRTIIKSAKVQEKLAPGGKPAKKVDFFEVRELNPAEAVALKKTLREVDSVVFGSVSSRTLSGKKTKLPKDVDLATKSVDKFNKAFIRNLDPKLRLNYRISKEKIVRKTDGVKILDVKPIDRLYPNKLFGTSSGNLPVYSLKQVKGKKPILQQAPTIFTTQKPVKVEGIKLTSFGEQTTRKALGTLQVILEKAPRRAKDPSAFLESLEIQVKSLRATSPKTKLGKLRKAKRIKTLNDAIKYLKSKEFSNLLESKVPGLTKEYPLVSKIDVKKLKKITRTKPVLKKRSVAKPKPVTKRVLKKKTVLKKKSVVQKKPVTRKKVKIKQKPSRLPKTKSSRLRNAKASRLPKTKTSRIPIARASRLPLSAISRLPISTISKLPLTTISKLPIAVISKLPLTTISKLPVAVISKLPLTTISKLPVATVSKLPIAKTRQLLVTPSSKLVRPKLTWNTKLPKGYEFIVNARYKKGNRVITRTLKTTPNRARKLMNSFVDKNIVASYGLVIIGAKKIKDIKKPSMKKFTTRKGKDRRVQQTVEKRKNRLDSPGEKRQIKAPPKKKRKVTKKKPTRKKRR